MGHRLSKIYTRTGDGGDTGLADGSRVGKDSPRIAAYGELDELNSHLGLALAFDPPENIAACLGEIQQILFDLGGDLCIPGRDSLAQRHIDWLERWLDHLNGGLPPLKEFVLPGGNRPAACCHVARAVCRRAERTLAAFAKAEPVPPLALAFLNRLSDLLFVMARSLARQGAGGETLWRQQRPEAPAPR
jgi:cob(I)alamin adenosyltransferase